MAHAPSRISARISAIGESATLAVDAKAKALKAAGRPVIAFGAGEPDFPTPDYIVEAAQRACAEPRFHKYTPAAGLPELREAIAAKSARDSGLVVPASQILVTNGGKHAVYQSFATLLDPGDEVLLPTPYWTTYPESIALAGGIPVLVHTDETSGYLATVEQLEAHCTDRTKVLLFVSPSNPTGAVYPPEQVAEIGRWAAERGIWVITDEIYEHLVYGDARFVSMPVVSPGDRRPLPRAERSCQNLCDDWLAGRLDGRARGRHQGGDQPSVARHLERLQRRAGRRPRRGVGRPVRGRADASGIQPAASGHDGDAERCAGRCLPAPGRRFLLLSVGQGRSR